jgi:lipoprotein-anchoring transpeptidase ErfK/SrfK
LAAPDGTSGVRPPGQVLAGSGSGRCQFVLDGLDAVGQTGGMTRARRLQSTFGAVAIIATIGLAGCSGGAAHPAAAPGSAPVPAPASAATTDPSAPGPSAASSPSAAPTAPSPKPPAPAGPLKIGSKGPAVVHLQQQLTGLGYWVGRADGKFGGTTQQAVYAVQKAAGLSRTGVVNASTQAAIDRGARPSAKSKTGKVIEVNLYRNLVLFVTNGHVDYILNTSTGGGYVYYDQGEREVAITPKGHFATYRVIDGPRRSTLGLLIRPRYFTGGFAIHGDGSVPAYPASHGCVRVSNAAIDWIWSTNLDPIGTKVWIY